MKGAIALLVSVAAVAALLINVPVAPLAPKAYAQVGVVGSPPATGNGAQVLALGGGSTTSNVTALTQSDIYWKAGGVLPSIDSWACAAFGGASANTMIAVAGWVTASTSAAVSTNLGATWTAETLPSSHHWTSCAWSSGIGLFVASGGNTTAQNAAAYSSDGVTWTASTMPSTARWSGIGCNSTTCVAVSSAASSAAAYTTNGTTWTASTLPASAEWGAVCWNGTVFLAIAGDGGNYVATSTAATSPDGITWTARTLPSSQSWTGCAWNGSIFLVVSGGFGGFSTGGATSPDGITWTAVTLPAGKWGAPTWNGRSWAMQTRGLSSTIAAYSLDAKTWQQTTMPTSTNYLAAAPFAVLKQ